MLVTNKYKQKTDSKKDATRRIRHSSFESANRSKPRRHDQTVCPVCGKPIEKTASGGRRKHSCSQCGACLNLPRRRCRFQVLCDLRCSMLRSYLFRTRSTSSFGSFGIAIAESAAP